MGNFLTCCRQRQEIIDFNELESLDPELKKQIEQMRKDNERWANGWREYKSGLTVFRGTMDQNNRRDGYGQLYKLQLAYFGTFKGDKPNGYGIIIKSDQEYYRGQFSDGKYHGKGRQFSHLHEFQGEFENGSRKKGILRTNAFQYQGEFHDNLFDGHGSLRFADGGIYQGMFKAGKYNGKGFLTFANGNRYQGNFSQGKYDGESKFIWKDGVAAIGSYSMGERKQRTLVQNHGWSKPLMPTLSKLQTEEVQSARGLKWFEYSQIPKVKSGDGMLYFF